MNHNITSAESGKSFTHQIRERRSTKGDYFAWRRQDFYGALLGLFGATQQQGGVWQLLDQRVSDVPCIGLCVHELGWQRWNLPSESGAEAHALISPEGDVFWSPRRFGTPSRIFSFGDFVRVLGYALPVRGVAA